MSLLFVGETGVKQILSVVPENLVSSLINSIALCGLKQKAEKEWTTSRFGKRATFHHTPDTFLNRNPFRPKRHFNVVIEVLVDPLARQDIKHVPVLVVGEDGLYILAAATEARALDQSEIQSVPMWNPSLRLLPVISAPDYAHHQGNIAAFTSSSST
jgi:hypothetical protein